MRSRFNIGMAVAASASLLACGDAKRFVAPDGQVQQSDAQPVAAVPSPGPHIDAISPAAARAGTTELTITVTGRGFVNKPHWKSLVRWSAANHNAYLLPTPVGDTQLVATVGPSLLGARGTANVWVENGDPQGDRRGAASNRVQFTVN